MLIGWSIVIYVAKYVTKEADLTVLFDPYTILDVSFTASEREIKSHYRKLSLKYHPDKLPKDLTEEQRSQAEQAYIRLTSAYKALTDEVTRKLFGTVTLTGSNQPHMVLPCLNFWSKENIVH